MYEVVVASCAEAGTFRLFQLDVGLLDAVSRQWCGLKFT